MTEFATTKKSLVFPPFFLQFFFLKRDIARKTSMENSLFFCLFKRMRKMVFWLLFFKETARSSKNVFYCKSRMSRNGGWHKHLLKPQNMPKRSVSKNFQKSINTQRQKPISSYPRFYFKGKVQDFLGEIDVVKLEKIGAAMWGGGWSVRNCSKMPFSHELIYLFLFSPCPFLKAFFGPNTKFRFFLRRKNSWAGRGKTRQFMNLWGGQTRGKRH